MNNRENFYDVIIVGAGPGGFKCAETLSNSNKKVLLLEKNKQLERKICGGFWGISEKTKKINLPENLFQRKYNYIYLTTPKKKIKVELEEPFLATIDRKDLSEYMFNETKKTNALIKFNSMVTEINILEKYLVVNNKDKYYFNYLVGADGANSIVRKKLNLNSKIGIGMQYFFEEKVEDFEIHFNPEKFSIWWGWIAPYKTKVTIGTGTDPKIKSVREMKKDLDNWCIEKGYDLKKGKYEGAPIPFLYEGYNFGNIFLIGDAAGFTSELTGEGIYFSIASGMDVANLIINPNYKPVLIEDILKIKRKHRFILNLFKSNRYIHLLSINLIFFLLRFNWFKKYVKELIA